MPSVNPSFITPCRSLRKCASARRGRLLQAMRAQSRSRTHLGQQQRALCPSRFPFSCLRSRCRSKTGAFRFAQLLSYLPPIKLVLQASLLCRQVRLICSFACAGPAKVPSLINMQGRAKSGEVGRKGLAEVNSTEGVAEQK